MKDNDPAEVGEPHSTGRSRKPDQNLNVRAFQGREGGSGRRTGMQLELPISTAANPQGASASVARDRSVAMSRWVPKEIINAEPGMPATSKCCPRSAVAGVGMIRGRKPADDGVNNLSSRRAGCEQRMSGSVGAGGGRPPLATRRAPGMARSAMAGALRSTGHGDLQPARETDPGSDLGV